MTECQGCGAWNERRRSLCVLCGTPLAETDEWDATAQPPPLPPLPDGGLSVSMPAWLRALPSTPEPQTKVPLTADEDEPAAALTLADTSYESGDLTVPVDQGEAAGTDATPDEQPLGPQADPRTFLRDEDFPRWIRELPSLPPRSAVRATVITARRVESIIPAAPLAIPAAMPIHIPEPAPEPQAPPQHDQHVALMPAAEPPDAMAATPPAPTARRREAWETPLLVLLVVGVVAAVIWALLVNGLIGSSL